MNFVPNWGFRSTRAYRRFIRARDGFAVRLDASAPWEPEATKLLNATEARLTDQDLEGAWDCLNQALRLEIPYLRGQKLANRRLRLRTEVTKIASSWRRRTIETLLKDEGGEPSQAVNLEAAQELMDDYFQTQYFKNGLLHDQLRNLVLISIGALAALVVLLGSAPAEPDVWPVWDWRALLMVLLFGVLGASFSATRKLSSDSGKSRIPERVAQGWVTIARTVLGATPALAAYAFLRAGILNIGMGSFESVLVVSFAAGFSERLVLNLLHSLEGTDGDAEKPSQDGKASHDKTKPPAPEPPPEA